MDKLAGTIEELKQFLIETLALEEIQPEDIDADAPLFGKGLGLDSLDALELGVALEKKYGVKVDAEAEETKEYFSSLRHLAQLVATTQISPRVA